MGNVPDWAEQIHGAAPILLVAPHGGRRPARSELDLQAPRKANDLGTAELTIALARRSGASAIVNHGLDRNGVDLNRVTHVRRHAPWLFELLLESARRQIEESGRAKIVFIHGWNAIQASCDVGIGARLDTSGFVAVREGLPTIPAKFVPGLLRFAEACSEDGIEMTFGDRYPAAARENMLQAFTARYADDRDPTIRELARFGVEGKIAAVQLELAVPLRWEGPYRERFVARTVDWLRHDPADPRATAAGLPVPPPDAVHVAAKRISLEFHDGSSGVGGFAGIERLTTGRRHARLLLCLGRSRIGLFTGEHPSGNGHPLSCAGLRWIEIDSDHQRLEYEGPFLLFGRSDPFLDLESGLAGSELTTLRASIEWRALGASQSSRALARPGRVTGFVEIGGSKIPVDAHAPLGPPPAAPGTHWSERRVVHAALGGDVLVSLVSESGTGESSAGEVIRSGSPEPVLSARVQVRPASDGVTPEGWRIESVSKSGPLRIFGQVTAAVPVIRPGGSGRVLTYRGLARFQAGDRVGHGTFEISQRLDETSPAEPGSRSS